MNKEFLKKHGINLLLILTVAFEVILLIYYNVFHIRDSLDHDFAKVIRHVIEMGNNRTLFLKNFDYMSQGEMDEASLIALPIYMLTGNVYLGYSIAGIVNVALYGFIFWRILDMAGLKARYKFCSFIFVFTAYEFGMLEYTNMMFYGAGYYVYKVLLPLLLIIALLSENKGKWKKADIFITLLYFILLFFVCVASKTYVVICGLFPVFAAVFIAVISGVCRSGYKRFGIISALSFAEIIISLKISSLAGIGVYSYPLKAIDDIRPDHLKTFMDMLLVFQPLTADYGEPPFSAKGFTGLLRLGMALIIIIFGLLSINRFLSLKLYSKAVKKQDGNDENGLEQDEGEDRVELLKSCLITVFAFNYIMVFLVKYSSPRYLLIGVIPLMLLASINISGILEKDKKTILPGLAMAGLSIVAVIVSLFNLYDAVTGYFHREDWNTEMMATITGYMNEYDIGTAFMVNETEMAEKLRAYNTERVFETYLTDDNTVYNHIFYITEKDRAAFTDRNILIATNENYDECPDYIKDNYRRLWDVGDYGIYYSEVNPIDGISGLPLNDRAIDLPTAPGYSRGDNINDKGYLVCDSAGVLLLSEPLRTDGKRSFHLKYNYEITDKDAEIYFDFFKGTELIDSCLLDSDSGVFEMDMPLEKGDYAYSIRSQKDSHVILKEMEMTASKP